VNAQFLVIARDPRVIPGVHHYCDEWCDYCAVPARCLLYRCTEQYRKCRGLADSDPTFATIEEAAAFTRELSAAEGVRTDELDALLSHPPGQSGVRTSDSLAELAWQYAERIAVVSAPLALEWAMASATVSAERPTPAETLFWYQLRIYMKVFRTLVARETHAGGAWSDDARGCGKLALVSIDRSLDALAQLHDSFAAADLREIEHMLTQLRDGLESRVPGARAYVRIGIDEPAASV
jgi:hypothetical protein